MNINERAVKKKDFVPKNLTEEFLVTVKYAALFCVALLYWEILLRTQIGFEGINLYFVLFLPAEGMFLAALTGWFKPKLNRFATTVVMILPFIFYIVQLIYYRIFGSMFSVSMIGLGTDAVENFGWALWSTIKDSSLWILLCLVPVIFSALFSYSGPTKFFFSYRPILHIASLCSSVLLWFLAVLLLLPFGTSDSSPYGIYSSNYVDTDTASGKLGVLTNSVVELGYMVFGSSEDEDDGMFVPTVPDDQQQGPQINTSPNIMNGIDFNTLKNLTNDTGKQALCDYLLSVKPTNKNEKTGILKDYNLIYICAESFSSAAIHPTITPTLYKLSQGGIVLNNFYNSFKNTTTNGEYAFMTGLWPDVSRDANMGSASGSFPQSKNKLLPFALGNIFEKKGVKTYAYHNFKGYYYSREETHPNLGYSTTRFMGGTNGMKFTTAWPSSDYEMMQQSIGDYINNEQFHAYYMTFSGHGPYTDANPICVRNLSTVRQATKGMGLTEEAIYYYAANYELEKAMKYLLEELEKAGKLNNTLIVLTGDHYPYYLSANSLNSIMGKKVDADFEKYKSSCIMWCGGIETIKVDTPCCNVDIIPTVLNLFDIEYDSRLLPGTDIFSSGNHVAMLYNKSFVTDKVMYNAQSGKAQWFIAEGSMTEEQKKQYLDYYIATTKSNYKFSLELMKEDFYRFVFDNMN